MEKADIPTESFSHQSFTGLTSVASETGFIHVSSLQKNLRKSLSVKREELWRTALCFL